MVEEWEGEERDRRRWVREDGVAEESEEGGLGKRGRGTLMEERGEVRVKGKGESGKRGKREGEGRERKEGG